MSVQNVSVRIPCQSKKEVMSIQKVSFCNDTMSVLYKLMQVTNLDQYCFLISPQCEPSGVVLSGDKAKELDKSKFLLVLAYPTSILFPDFTPA